MRISSNISLFTSEKDAIIVYAGEENKRYHIFTDKIDYKTKAIQRIDSQLDSTDPILFVDKLGDKFIYLAGNIPYELNLFNPTDGKLIGSKISCAFTQKNNIYYFVNTEVVESYFVSKLYMNGEEKEIATYKGIVYKIIISDSKVAFLYYNSNENEITYGIKIFNTFDDFLNPSNRDACKDIQAPHIGKVCDISFTSDCNFLYSCGYDGYVKKWDLTSPDIRSQLLFLSEGPIVSVKSNPILDDVFVASSTLGQILISTMEKVSKKFLIYDKNKEFEPASWAEFSKSNPFLVVASGISTIKSFYLDKLL